LNVFRFTALPGAPILQRFRSPADARGPEAPFVRDGLLCHLRRYLDDETFDECRRSALFREHPMLLHSLLRYAVMRDARDRPLGWLRKLQGKRVAVWGTGGRWRQVVAPFLTDPSHAIAIDCFVDSDSARQGKELEGKPVIAPRALPRQRGVDAIVLATCFVDDVVQDLCRYGLNAVPRYAF